MLFDAVRPTPPAAPSTSTVCPGPILMPRSTNCAPVSSTSGTAATAERIVATDDPKALDLLHDLDAVADTIGGPVAARTLRTLRPGGVFGTVLAPPADANKYDVRVAAISCVPDTSRLYELADEVARGLFTIPIAKILPLEQVREAQSEAESGKVGGKVVLTVA